MTVIVSVNLGNRGSTGKIMRSISALAEENGYVAYQAYPGSRANLPSIERDIVLCNFVVSKINRELARITGYNGCFAVISTLRFLHRLDKIKPDILHFHNLHNSYINLPLLFRYVKKNNIRVIWTLHDCWAFTGRCPYFTMSKCDKWKTGCGKCPFPKESYPQAIVDRTAKMWRLKKKWFTGIEDMTIVTPSEWLADLVKESFLKEYPIKVINNGIDLTVFKPTDSDFRERCGISSVGGGKYLILGVADSWSVYKGLDVFIELAKRLNEQYQIVLVGTNNAIDEQLPGNIISIHRTQNQHELAEIYTAADVLVNPTREEVLGLVNIESLACGTPVITFQTGGSPECIDMNCGTVVPYDGVDALESEINRICNDNPYSAKACISQAYHFEQQVKYRQYIDIYSEEKRE